jgi:GTP-binding protein YchF
VICCGIVGLPNVGKSTLFNALTATQAAQAANYPFCTIEPNVGRVAVPDPRLEKICALAGSAKIIPAQMEFVDIAGLVRGASKGEGLGNQFLGHIREVDAVAHVLRCFEDADITHVEGSVDPLRDAATIETELMLADLESLEKRRDGLARRVKGGDKAAAEELAVVQKVLPILEAGQPARTAVLTKDEQKPFRLLQLLTAKPLLYICNVLEAEAATGNALVEKVRIKAAAEGAPVVVIAAAVEAEAAQLSSADQREFLETLGLQEPGLNTVIRAAYSRLGLLTYFTAGPQETRAWTIIKGTKAPQAAAVIHTDFERGFIAAATIGYDDFLACKGETGAKEAGKLRVEGKEYVFQDGDVVHFRFNV